ncbi:MAG: alpha/beta hydrolase [Bacteroidia bacterium]
MKPLRRLKFILLVVFLVFATESCKKDNTTPDCDLTVILTDTSLLNVAYGTEGRQVYDIHLPANRTMSTPVILMIHGGAWRAGQKEDFNSYINIIQSKWDSVAIVTMNYRLASNVDSIHHDEMMEDINSVVNHLNSNKSSYHISNKLAIMGASAGGQLAMIYAYKYNTEIKCVGSIFGPTIMNDWSWYNSNNVFLGGYVGDILAQYVGQTWDTTAYKAVSPYWNVSSSTQPTIIFHGSLDPIVPTYHSQWLHGKLNSLSVVNEYHEYVAFHSFDSNQSNDVLTKLVAFFKSHLE